MDELAVPRQDLSIPRGATWYARAWVLLGDDGDPLRAAPVEGMPVAAKIRAHPTATEVLFAFNAEPVLIALPDAYGAEPVLCAQLAAISHTITSAWTWDTAVWDLTVAHQLVLAGSVSAPLVVSR